jgi:quinohemoprotein amine dehydrogenase
MSVTIRPSHWFLAIAGLVAAAIGSASALAQDAESLLNEKCSACHERRSDGGLNRISDVRKTPEGWFMNIVRMETVHGLELSDDERAVLVKYLADTQGLAPSETEGWRYVLERTPGAIDTAPTEDLGQMCGRCHTFARVALQRRDTDEWRKLVNFHLGQFPTTEYQALGRDRDWFAIASETVAEDLGKRYPLSTEAWDSWKDRAAPDLSGTWVVVGRQPGKGFYEGSMQVTASGDDTYHTVLSLQYADGTDLEETGSSIVYTGHEWRGSKNTPDGWVREVLEVSEDDNVMTGRWYFRDNDVIGGSITAVRAGGSEPQILAVNPPYIKQGGKEKVTIIGIGMEGDPNLGDGVAIKNVITQSSDKMVVEAVADATAAPGPRTVSAGQASGPDAFVVYDKVDGVVVEPGETISRIGGGGGAVAPVPAQFEAVGVMAGADGQVGTDDDVRIGVMDAAWSVENFDEMAKMLSDAKYAGSIDNSGLFAPATAGPNPKRKMDANNVGNLTVVATVDDDGNKVEGTAHLYATVQRFIDPPIR